ncbi:MAG: hypothetical protein JXR49_09010 [Acidobacteria bacterium]|nr:hypothetical protein [Acidobacteriota bacterium]
MSQDETEGKARQFQAPVRTDKHLARSLEDVSHLFLSKENARNGSPDKLSGDSKGQVSPLPGDRPVFLREDRSQPLQKDGLIALLNSNIGILEDGLKTIDTNVSMDSGGPVDLVAVDRFNKLSLIDIDVSGSDALLLRGICHFDWFVRNVPIVRRMYHGRVIDYSAHPRIFLVAPKFSAMFRCAAQRIACTQIHCYLYQITAGSGGTGILLTRI